MNSKASAMAEYNKSLSTAYERLERIRQAILARDRTLRISQQTDWADVGSLQKVSHELGDILEFLGVPKPN